MPWGRPSPMPSSCSSRWALILTCLPVPPHVLVAVSVRGDLLSYQSSAFFLFQMAGFRQPPAETETPNSALTRVPRQGLYLDRKIKVAGPISAISCSISEVNFLRQKMNSPKYTNEAGFPWSKPQPDRVGVGRKRFMPKHLQSPPKVLSPDKSANPSTGGWQPGDLAVDFLA